MAIAGKPTTQTGFGALTYTTFPPTGLLGVGLGGDRFWITIAIIVSLHVPLIVLIPWPYKQLSSVALLPAGLLDFAIAYGIIRLIENMIERVRPGKQLAE
jgi:hypothetical protein